MRDCFEGQDITVRDGTEYRKAIYIGAYTPDHHRANGKSFDDNSFRFHQHLVTIDGVSVPVSEQNIFYRKHVKLPSEKQWKREIFRVGPSGYAFCTVLEYEINEHGDMQWCLAEFKGEQFFCEPMYGTFGRIHNSYSSVDMADYFKKRYYQR